tara:strand:- start:945 stop:2069 length:1125 start_codon:yes stop_codon:yes gene_type:complete
MALDRLGSNAIADLAVSAADIAAGTITTAKIANDAVTTAKIANTVNLGRRNVVINGNFHIAQRSTSAVAAANNYNTVDRWKHFKNGAGAFTTQRVADHPMGHGYSLKCQVTTADTSIAATDYAFTETNLEGQDCSSFLYGTSNAKDVTISFWCKSNKTGTYCVALYKHAGAGTAYMYRKEYTISTANTWEKKTVTVSPTAGSTSLITASPASIVNDNGAGIQLVFGLTWGSNFHGTDDTWQTGGGYGTSNQVNWLDNTANNFYLTEVQLEVGDTATPFEHLPIGQQMELCQRYYYKENYTTAGPFATLYETGHKFIHLFHPTTMRTTPTSTPSYAGGTQTEYHSTNKHFKSYIGSAYNDTTQRYLTAYQAEAEL